MDKLDVILWAMGSGFAVQFALMGFMWNSINKRIDRLELRMDAMDIKLDKLNEKVNSLDRTLCRLEGAFSTKECCMLKQDQFIRRAE